MTATPFDREPVARWYADQHLAVDPGVRAVYHLKTNSPEREVRLLEVNDLMGEMKDTALEPFVICGEAGTAGEHRLAVLDVTPSQWDRLMAGRLPLPPGWSMAEAVLMGEQARIGRESA